MKFSEMDSKLANKLMGQRVQPSMGGDPEFFVANGRGKVLNADAFFPSKHEPIEPPTCSSKNKLFFDGIQAEIAFGHSTCRDDVLSNIRYCLSTARDKIQKENKILLKPSARIDREIIENADPEARIFGCAPDFNAYTRSVNTPEMDATNHPFRYAGGHMHLGMSCNYQKEGFPEYDLVHRDENHLRIVKFLDFMVSIPTLILDSGVGSKRRRDKYGKAGCFRPTPYGIEYRTPSCWWLKSPMTASLIFGFAKLAWTLLVKNLDGDLLKAIEPEEETIRGIINESDTKSSIAMWKKMRPYVAVAGKEDTNPMNLRSVRISSAYDDPTVTSMMKNTYKFQGVHVFPLAVFEYAISNGLESIISKDIDKEWAIGAYKDENFSGTHGFVIGSYRRFKENQDFLKFQNSMMKELY